MVGCVRNMTLYTRCMGVGRTQHYTHACAGGPTFEVAKVFGSICSVWPDHISHGCAHVSPIYYELGLVKTKSHSCI